jgi:uncharacterized membrane protein
MAEDDVVEKSENGAGSGDVVRLALEHKDLLVPAVVGVAGALAAAKGPSVVRGLSGAGEEKLASTAESVGAKAAEGAKDSIGGGLAGKALGKLTGGGSSGKKTRRLPIQRWTDVAVPVDQAYEAWTKFNEFPKFMHRVLNVEQKEDNKISWQEKIWFSKRQWEGEITERRKDDRIVWKTTSGMSHKGIISFHRLDDRLTRVMVEMEFEPTGLIEKMSSGLRFVKRAVEADLARFKAYVEMQDAKGIAYRSGDEQQDKDQNDDEDKKEGAGGREARQSGRRASRTRRSASATSSSNGQKRTSAKRSSAKRSSAKRGSAKRSTRKT